MNIQYLNPLIRQTLPNARMKMTALPLCPELKLYLLDPQGLDRPFSQDETRIILAHTPFWAFCWAGGQALAHYLLSHPEKARGKRVLDFGTGSGVAGIAAALAGAREVWACDTDENTWEAVKANAELNNVSIKTCKTLQDSAGPFDLLLAADVLYDRENLYFLDIFLEHARDVLVAESRLKNIDHRLYQKMGEKVAGTLPELDAWDSHKQVILYEARQAWRRLCNR
jgi:predicted nicotinamide N-methyase